MLFITSCERRFVFTFVGRMNRMPADKFSQGAAGRRSAACALFSIVDFAGNTTSPPAIRLPSGKGISLTYVLKSNLGKKVRKVVKPARFKSSMRTLKNWMLMIYFCLCIHTYILIILRSINPIRLWYDIEHVHWRLGWFFSRRSFSQTEHYFAVRSRKKKIA